MAHAPALCDAAAKRVGASDRDPGPYMRKPPNRTPTRQPARHAAMISPPLSTELRRALVLLAGAGINGVTETVMLARGFARAMLLLLVRKGHATARWELVRAGRNPDSGRHQATACRR